MGSVSIETGTFYTLIEHFQNIYLHAFYPNIKAIALEALNDILNTELRHIVEIAIHDDDLRKELNLDEEQL